jgi:hypothetical protein
MRRVPRRSSKKIARFLAVVTSPFFEAVSALLSMNGTKRSFCEATDSNIQLLWGEVIGIDDKTDQERTFTVYTRSGSFLVVDDKGNERLAGPDSGLTKYGILREVMVQFQVHALRVKRSSDTKPRIA